MSPCNVPHIEGREDGKDITVREMNQKRLGGIKDMIICTIKF
jgi:hypothetical protein